MDFVSDETRRSGSRCSETSHVMDASRPEPDHGLGPKSGRSSVGSGHSPIDREADDALPKSLPVHTLRFQPCRVRYVSEPVRADTETRTRPVLDDAKSKLRCSRGERRIAL